MSDLVMFKGVDHRCMLSMTHIYKCANIVIYQVRCCILHYIIGSQTTVFWWVSNSQYIPCREEDIHENDGYQFNFHISLCSHTKC